MSASQMLAALRRRGYRITAQRQAIVERVAGARGHIAPEALGRALDRVDRSTVYRTLDLLERLGFLAHHHDATGIAYHHAGDHDHVHLACLACDHVGELEDRSIADELVRKLEQTQGFRANLGHSTIFGVCGGCAAAGHAPDTPHKHATEAPAAPR
jgi:Fur family ferric uptake transcriptional regulator